MQQQKSRAFYRIQATRMMIGAGNILKKHAADQARKVARPSFPVGTLNGCHGYRRVACSRQVVSSNETQAQEDDPHTVRFQFEPSLYQCFENCGSLKLTVARHGGDAGITAKVAEAKVALLLPPIRSGPELPLEAARGFTVSENHSFSVLHGLSGSLLVAEPFSENNSHQGEHRRLFGPLWTSVGVLMQLVGVLGWCVGGGGVPVQKRGER